MERIVFIGVVLLASLVFNLLSHFLPVAGRRMVEVVNAETRFVEVAPGYEGWYQPAGGTVRDSSWLGQVQVAGRFPDEEDEDGNLEEGTSDDGDWDLDEND